MNDPSDLEADMHHAITFEKEEVSSVAENIPLLP